MYIVRKIVPERRPQQQRSFLLQWLTLYVVQSIYPLLPTADDNDQRRPILRDNILLDSKEQHHEGICTAPDLTINGVYR